MREVRATAIATYLPRERIANGDLPPLEPPLSVERIDRFGIASRTRANDSETVVMMAERAARSALDEANVDPATLDFILLANWSERRYVPDVAPLVQHVLGARRAFACDLCAACCGFVYGLAMGSALLQNPRFQRGLVLASDRSSRRMRPGSRATIVFGDAAAACVLQAGEAAEGRGFRVADYELRSDGSKNGIMEVDADGYLKAHIRQHDLNALAGQTMAEAARGLLDRNRLTLADIDYVVPHSGTAGVQAQLLEHLGVEPEKVLTNLPSIGNVTSASIPCALRHFMDEGRIQPSHTVLSVAVGLGWQYVATLFRP